MPDGTTATGAGAASNPFAAYPAPVPSSGAFNTVLNEHFYNFDKQGIYNDYNRDVRDLGFAGSDLQADQARNAARYQFIDRDQALADQSLANRMSGFGLDRTTLGRESAAQRRSYDADTVAGGAQFAPHRRLGMADLHAAEAEGQQRIGLGEEAARIGRAKEQVSFDEARSDVKFQGDALNRAAEKLGATRADLELDLNRALQELGLGQALTGLDLFTNMEGVNAETAAFLADVKEKVQQMLGLPKGGW